MVAAFRSIRVIAAMTMVTSGSTFGFAQPVVDFLAGGNPAEITRGPDGNVWFATSGASVVRMTATGVTSVFSIPNASSLNGIVAGPDGNLWAVDRNANSIFKVTTNGSSTQFVVPTPSSSPYGIAVGPDGALWFTESQGNKIGRIPITATIANPQFQEFAIPTPASEVKFITAGSDGAIWFTERGASKIGRIAVNATPANPQIREYPTPNSNSTPNYITSGPDGALWFTETTVNKIGRIPVTATPGSSAQITEFAIPTANSFPQGIVSGPDGALWFAESNSSKIGRITATGLVTELATPTGGSSPNSITVGPDNNIWVTEAAVSVNRIARLQVDKPSQSLIIVGHGDLDLDGTQDVVLRDPISRGITVWYMSAGQIAQSVVLAPSMPNSWTFLGVGDFAGDGRARLLWRNSESGEVGFWTVSGRGASISWSSIAIGVFTGWSFQGIADVNGDRRSDIIWRYVDGVIGAWTMNGATITSWQPFPNLP